MKNAKASGRSSNRWDTLSKNDYPRGVDDWINYFGERSSRTGGPVSDVPGRGKSLDLGRKGVETR